MSTAVQDNRLAVLDHSRLRAKANSKGEGRGHISVRNLHIEFDHQGGKRAAVQDAQLDIRPGEFVCLLGPSGCGKSTLLNAMAGFVSPTRGELTIDGKGVDAPSPDRGMVFQQHSLFPWKTVRDNVAFGPLMAGASRNEACSVARTFLSLVGLAAFEDAYPGTLSGGMQQRVGIARALANYPSVLLMDEPFGALDAQTRIMMQENLLEIWREFRNTVVFVTHDIDEAVFLSDRIVVMSASPGRIIADIKVTLPRPREQSLLTSAAFMDYKRQCLDLIRQETLRAFQQQNGG
ncbi:MAG: ABC transporter ATP-binding protein [Gammaproteobacteria bacterium HGW-Gammaproteobacteria-9]|jgi:NitT/TauT family transport system ATP-binding protein|uniref:ABC transporter ATP-binding protein n=1 Tax=Pseudomonadaceae TaxID=135621 RepID=UPI0009BA8387|nr:MULTISPECIES: ABC transporter ATP-binding protein [Pseudomonadaceae]MDH2243252.1 ABC transporter ATP-binding protein [Pseudomonas sp. GD03909]PKM00745.1 MAG: ABC transporter ATP-binding protein [Gammaproteobacteria bacterium HGW-Gammaproteobacteria-9]HBW10180.1 ABC transporter ATP-binding protein [Pseudomonas sp.]|tara:strand:- start:783 stop:1655 length:873 start_codon:yes stop_codon:yes gene_type:complete